MRHTHRLLVPALLLSTACIPLLSAPRRNTVVYAPASSTTKPGVLYPRAIELQNAGANNGTLLATFEEYADGTPTFPIYRSTNGGLSWKLLSRVSDSQNGWGFRFQPFLYELPQALGSMPAGTLLCAGNSIPKDLSQTSLDLYKSLDHGRTWSFVSRIARGGAANPDGTQDPVWEPFLLLSQGKLIAYYSDERDPAHNQKIVHQTSVDGTTWGSIVEDVALETKQRPGMPVVAPMGNGRYILSYECICDGTAYTSIKTSSNPEYWNAADTGFTVSRAGGTPYVAWTPSGGKNGSVIVSANAEDKLYINHSYGAPDTPWTLIPAAVGFGYSRSFVVLSKKNSLFEISPIAQPNGYNHIISGVQKVAR